MKLPEPKTPDAKQYDPAEDEEEIEAINAREVVVDELDQVKGKRSTKDEDIPDIDIGEPENLGLEHSRTPDGERRVIVDPDQNDEGFHGEEPPDLPAEEKEKHAKFEAARKKHYEMKNVKNLLGYVPPQSLGVLRRELTAVDTRSNLTSLTTTSSQYRQCQRAA
jgi:protein phosphatase inhibitor 2